MRDKWVGLLLPLAPGISGAHELAGRGVCSGTPVEPVRAYTVLAEDALVRLEEHSAEAAEWWRKNTPHLFVDGGGLLFHEFVCEYLPNVSS